MWGDFMKVAVGQLNVSPGDVDRNFKRGENLIKQAKDEECKLILLPEVWTTGFPFKKLKDLSNTTPQILEEIKKLSKDIMVCGTYITDSLNSDKVFNTFYAILNGEVVFSYKKMMLFGLTGEDKYFDKGDLGQKNTFKALGSTFGVSICYELRFPELFRKASFDGALIHLNPAIWPKTRLDHWLVLGRSRAIENQLFFLTSNGVGLSDKWEIGGYSAIYDPWGEVKSQIKNEEGLAINDIALETVEDTREKLSSLKDSMAAFGKLYF